MIQEVLAFITLAVAVVFLLKKFFWKKSAKAKKNSKSCGDDCGCH